MRLRRTIREDAAQPQFWGNQHQLVSPLLGLSLLGFASAFLILCNCLASAAPRLVTPGEINSSQVAARALESVVTVEARLPPEALQPGESDLSRGSGFLVAPGVILTNAHVLQGANRVTVRLRDGTRLQANQGPRDPGLDLALLRVAGARAVPLEWGRSGELMPGQTLIVLGAPEGMPSSVSVGVYGSQGPVEQPDDQLGADLDSMLLTDARIVPGNSGGPVLDSRGRVVGVAAANIRQGSILSDGLGLAIPADAARPAVTDLLKYGGPRRGDLGARLEDVGDLDPLVRSTAKLPPRGAVVIETDPESSAERAGLRGVQLDAEGRLERLGDVILAVGERRVNSARAARREVARRRAGDRLKLRLWRAGAMRTVTVQLLPPAPR